MDYNESGNKYWILILKDSWYLGLTKWFGIEVGWGNDGMEGRLAIVNLLKNSLILLIS